MMGYTASFIREHGQQCTIMRSPAVTSYVSMTLATRGYSDNRDMFREGLILASSNLAGGEVLTVGGEKFLTRSVSYDAQSGELAFFASKVNAVLTHKRFVETVDAFGNVTKAWSTITSSVQSTAQVVTAALLERDPGLLPNTKWVFLVPNTVPVLLLDRLIFGTTPCQVDAVDDMILPGLLRVQCSDDQRGG